MANVESLGVGAAVVVVSSRRYSGGKDLSPGTVERVTKARIFVVEDYYRTNDPTGNRTREFIRATGEEYGKRGDSFRRPAELFAADAPEVARIREEKAADEAKRARGIAFEAALTFVRGLDSESEAAPIVLALAEAKKAFDSERSAIRETFPGHEWNAESVSAYYARRDAALEAVEPVSARFFANLAREGFPVRLETEKERYLRIESETIRAAELSREPGYSEAGGNAEAVDFLVSRGATPEGARIFVESQNYSGPEGDR